VAYNAMDTREIDQIKSRMTPEALSDFRREHGLEGKKIAVFCGRLIDQKKPQVFVKAMKKVIERVDNAHGVLIGDGPLTPEVEQLIKELGLTDHITMAGAVYEEELSAKYYMCSRVSVMPAYAGLAIQHAFGYGVPFIIGDIKNSHGPEAELIVEGVNGMYCKDEDIDDFADAICRLLGDDALHARMSGNALDLIETKYNVYNMAEGIVQAVRYCIPERFEVEVKAQRKAA
jgi:glycosyltransferase involved in cell wall biosynthesis